MKRYNIDLSDKIVAITGAAGAICSSFSRELAAVGAKIALIDINLDGAEKVAESIRARILPKRFLLHGMTMKRVTRHTYHWVQYRIIPVR